MLILNKIDKWWVKNKYGVVYRKSEKLLYWLGAVVSVGGIAIMLVDIFTGTDVFYGGATVGLFGICLMLLVMLQALRKQTLALMK